MVSYMASHTSMPRRRCVDIRVGNTAPGVRAPLPSGSPRCALGVRRLFAEGSKRSDNTLATWVLCSVYARYAAAESAPGLGACTKESRSCAGCPELRLVDRIPSPLLSACGGSSTEASSGGSAKTKGIGLAYDIGGKGDQSFNDAAYAGFQKAETDLKIGGRDIEPQDGESDADKVQRLEQLAKSGYNPVIGVGFVYAPAVKEVAAKYPKITFGIIDDEQDKAANVADMVFHEEQASYLAGVAAAKATKKNHIGFVGGVDIPLIHKFEAGYVQGAQSVNPKIKIEKQYLTQTPQEVSFSSHKGKDAAEGQIEAGADVIYAAAGLSGSGCHPVRRLAQGVGHRRRLRPVQDALAKYKDYIDFGHQGRRRGGLQPREVGGGRQARDRRRPCQPRHRRRRPRRLEPGVQEQRRPAGRAEEGRGGYQGRLDHGQDLLTGALIPAPGHDVITRRRNHGHGNAVMAALRPRNGVWGG